MIGADFEIADNGIERVEWLKSDGSAYIDLAIAFTSDMMIEVEAEFPNGQGDAPGYVWGAAQQSNGTRIGLKAITTEQTIYRGLNGAALNQFYSNGVATDCKSYNGPGDTRSITYLQKGRVSTNESGAVTSFTAVTMPLGRNAAGSLVWAPPWEYSAARGVTVTKTTASASMSETFDWGGEFTVTLNVPNLSIQIYDNAKGVMFYSGQYVAPALREAETVQTNHQLGIDIYGQIGPVTQYSDSSQSEYPLPCNGLPRKVLFHSIGGYYTAAWGYFLLDRLVSLHSEGSTVGESRGFPNTSLFAFAMNDGLLNPVEINSTMKLSRVKIFLNRQGSITGPQGRCVRDMVAALKTGAGAGLYDIIQGKFYAARGGTMQHGGQKA